MSTEIGTLADVRGPCTWDGCGAPGRLVGFGCPGFREVFACEAHDPRAGSRPTGFRHHRVRRRVGLRVMADALGWSPSRVSSVETGRERMDRLELAYWWATLHLAAARERSALEQELSIVPKIAPDGPCTLCSAPGVCVDLVVPIYVCAECGRAR